MKQINTINFLSQIKKNVAQQRVAQHNFKMQQIEEARLDPFKIVINCYGSEYAYDLEKYIVEHTNHIAHDSKKTLEERKKELTNLADCAKLARDACKKGSGNFHKMRNELFLIIASLR